jgi:predicted site-specific integrase-resolvase
MISDSEYYITLSEISARMGVNRARVKEYFKSGRIFGLVPRPQDPKSRWKIRRKDIEGALQDYEELTYRVWARHTGVVDFENARLHLDEERVKK